MYSFISCDGDTNSTKLSFISDVNGDDTSKVGSVIDRDFWVLEIGKYTVLYMQLSTLCVMYSDMMS